MIIWKKSCVGNGDFHEYIFSVMKMYHPLMIDSMCSPSMPYVIGEMATVMRQYSNGLLVFVLPEILEPFRDQLGVPCRVLNVAMAEPFLNCSGVVSIVGQLEAAGVAQHVRVHGEGKASPASLLRVEIQWANKNMLSIIRSLLTQQEILSSSASVRLQFYGSIGRHSYGLLQ